VCLHVEGMEAVEVRRNLDYGPQARTMDLYYPPRETGHGRWPVVVVVTGYPGTTDPRPTAPTFKEMGWTVSMCQLIALSGMVAVAYASGDPVADLQAVLEHVHERSGALRVEPTRVGVLAVSGSVPTALTAIMRNATRPPTCAVFGYGCLLDLDGETDVAAAARQFGFVNPGADRTLGDIRTDVPLLIARAGRDQFPAMNASIDRFLAHGLKANLPITLVNHPAGSHAFDLFDATTEPDGSYTLGRPRASGCRRRCAACRADTPPSA
jgi:dienelactone hydrolase